MLIFSYSCSTHFTLGAWQSNVMHVFWLLMGCLSLGIFVKIAAMLFLIMSSLFIRMVEIHTEIWKESSLRWIEGKGLELTIWTLDLMIGTCLQMVGFFPNTPQIWSLNFEKLLYGSENWDIVLYFKSLCTIRKLYFFLFFLFLFGV